MGVAVQELLLDMCDGGPALGALGDLVRRTTLAHGAWVDLRPGWLAGSGAVFGRLAEAVPWRAEKRHMYDKVVDVPRLTCFYGEDEVLPDPVLAAAREALNAHYGPELGEPFRTAGLCLYRDGRDSVAWHGDTIGRGSTEDTMVAILSLGTPRALLLRPRTGGASRRFEVGHGDLLVMGGSCQRTWEHAVPKTARATGARISVQFRPRGVRLPGTPAKGRRPHEGRGLRRHQEGRRPRGRGRGHRGLGRRRGACDIQRDLRNRPAHVRRADRRMAIRPRGAWSWTPPAPASGCRSCSASARTCWPPGSGRAPDDAGS